MGCWLAVDVHETQQTKKGGCPTQIWGQNEPTKIRVAHETLTIPVQKHTD